MACFSGISNYGICCNHRIQHSLFFCFNDSMKSKIHFSFVQEMVFIEAFRIGMGNSVCGRKSNHYIPASMTNMRTGTAKSDSNTFQQPVELTEEARQALDETLQEALRHPETPVQICYFRPDEWKSGGAYVEKIGHIRRIDVCGQMLEFADGEKIPLETIRSAGNWRAE